MTAVQLSPGGLDRTPTRPSSRFPSRRSARTRHERIPARGLSGHPYKPDSGEGIRARSHGCAGTAIGSERRDSPRYRWCCTCMVSIRSPSPLAFSLAAGIAQPQDLGRPSARTAILPEPATTAKPHSHPGGTAVFRGRLLEYTVLDGMAVTRAIWSSVRSRTWNPRPSGPTS